MLVSAMETDRFRLLHKYKIHYYSYNNAGLCGVSLSEGLCITWVSKKSGHKK